MKLLKELWAEILGLTLIFVCLGGIVFMETQRPESELLTRKQLIEYKAQEMGVTFQEVCNMEEIDIDTCKVIFSEKK